MKESDFPSNMKIAMFGGSFDPIHNAHVRLCHTMIEEIGIDRVIVFPTFRSPFKNSSGADSVHRLNMCRIAFENTNRVEVSDFEILKGGKSYTIDTLNEIKRSYPEAELYLIVGADAFLTLSDWYKSDEIFKLAHILTLVRECDDIEILKSTAGKYKKYSAHCTLIDKSVGDISSTDVRKRLYDNKDVSDVLPQSVIEYIKENKLYNYGN